MPQLPDEQPRFFQGPNAGLQVGDPEERLAIGAASLTPDNDITPGLHAGVFRSGDPTDYAPPWPGIDTDAGVQPDIPFDGSGPIGEIPPGTRTPEDWDPRGEGDLFRQYQEDLTHWENIGGEHLGFDKPQEPPSFELWQELHDPSGRPWEWLEIHDPAYYLEHKGHTQTRTEYQDTIDLIVEFAELGDPGAQWYVDQWAQSGIPTYEQAEARHGRTQLALDPVPGFTTSGSDEPEPSSGASSFAVILAAIIGAAALLYRKVRP